MKIITKITFVLFAFTLLFTACSKGDDDTPTPKIAAEITLEELKGYMIVEEFLSNPEYENSLGTKPYLFANYIIKNNSDGKHYCYSEGWFTSVASDVDQDGAMQYNATTGITTFKTLWGYYELTRDNNEQIIIKGNFHFTNNSSSVYAKWFKSNYTQLIKLDGKIYDQYTYKAIEGTSGYFRFQVYNWRYKQDAEPTTGELTWIYNKLYSNVWSGKDGGTEKLYNIFIAIPKGNGWKGNHKDKDLLLVNTGNNTKTVSDVAVCEKL